jgi:hypothetical protein
MFVDPEGEFWQFVVGALWGAGSELVKGGNLWDITKGAIVGAAIGGISGYAGNYAGKLIGNVSSNLGSKFIASVSTGIAKGAVSGGVSSYLSDAYENNDWKWTGKEWNFMKYGAFTGGVSGSLNYGVKSLNPIIDKMQNKYGYSEQTAILGTAGAATGVVEGAAAGYIGHKIFGWDRKKAMRNGMWSFGLMGLAKGYTVGVQAFGTYELANYAGNPDKPGLKRFFAYHGAEALKQLEYSWWVPPFSFRHKHKSLIDKGY